MTKWVKAEVVGSRHWTDTLHSLLVAAPEVTFVAGQFGRLALPAPPGSAEEMLGRPYSFVNAPGTQPHEFYYVTSGRGLMTIGDETREINQGDLVHIPPDTVHSLRPVSHHAPIHCFCFAVGLRDAAPVDYTS